MIGEQREFCCFLKIKNVFKFKNASLLNLHRKIISAHNDEQWLNRKNKSLPEGKSQDRAVTRRL